MRRTKTKAQIREEREYNEYLTQELARPPPPPPQPDAATLAATQRAQTAPGSSRQKGGWKTDPNIPEPRRELLVALEGVENRLKTLDEGDAEMQQRHSSFHVTQVHEHTPTVGSTVHSHAPGRCCVPEPE